MKKNNKQRLFEVMTRMDSSFKSPINENLNNWHFLTKDVDTSISNIDKIYPENEVDTGLPKFNVKWYVNPTIKDWGIKDIDIVIDGIFGVTYINLLDKNTHDIVEEDVEIDISNWKWAYDVNNNTEKFGNSLYPTSIDLDFNTMVCTVTFG